MPKAKATQGPPADTCYLAQVEISSVIRGNGGRFATMVIEPTTQKSATLKTQRFQLFINVGSYQLLSNLQMPCTVCPQSRHNHRPQRKLPQLCSSRQITKVAARSINERGPLQHTGHRDRCVLRPHHFASVLVNGRTDPEHRSHSNCGGHQLPPVCYNPTRCLVDNRRTSLSTTINGKACIGSLLWPMFPCEVAPSSSLERGSSSFVDSVFGFCMCRSIRASLLLIFSVFPDYPIN